MRCLRCGVAWNPGNQTPVGERCPICNAELEFQPSKVEVASIRELAACQMKKYGSEAFAKDGTLENLIHLYFGTDEKEAQEVCALLDAGIKSLIEQWEGSIPQAPDILDALKSFQMNFDVEPYCEDINYILGGTIDNGDPIDSAEFQLSYADTGREPSFVLKSLAAAHHMGNTEATLRLAKVLEKGSGGNKDLKKALIVLQEAEHRSEPEIYYQIARLYRLGRGAEQDLKTALRYFSLAAEAGHAKAKYQLCNIYRFKDSAKAVNYLIEASNEGYIPAMFEYAERLLYGDEVSLDRDKAISLLKECARNNHKEAEELLRAELGY